MGVHWNLQHQRFVYPFQVSVQTDVHKTLWKFLVLISRGRKLVLPPLLTPMANSCRVYIFRTPEGQSKGCAFVKLSTNQEAKTAIEALHGSQTMPVSVTSQWVSAPHFHDEFLVLVAFEILTALRRLPPCNGRNIHINVKETFCDSSKRYSLAQKTLRTKLVSELCGYVNVCNAF